MAVAEFRRTWHHAGNTRFYRDQTGMQAAFLGSALRSCQLSGYWGGDCVEVRESISSTTPFCNDGGPALANPLALGSQYFSGERMAFRDNLCGNLKKKRTEFMKIQGLD